MFKNLKSKGEITPLDSKPDMYIYHNWFLNAYKILSYSGGESGLIPLSELKIFEDKFGLIGTFEEFVKIIYAINDCISEFRNKESDK